MILGIEGLLIVVSYTFPAVMGILGYEVTHIAYVWVLLGLAVLFTITASTTVISRERETRAWPLLLDDSVDRRRHSHWQVPGRAASLWTGLAVVAGLRGRVRLGEIAFIRSPSFT